mgnify:FL=1
MLMIRKRMWAQCLGVLLLVAGLANAAPSEDVQDAVQKPVTVNINEASAEMLAAALDGIGLARAQAIVDYRTQFGRFYSAEELSAVRGIGTNTINRNLARIRVDEHF